MLSAERPHDNTDFWIVDVADIGEQMMLNLVLQTRAQKSTEPARTETHGSRRLDREKIRAVPDFRRRTLRIGRKMSRCQDSKHRVSQENASQNIELANYR